MTGFDSKRKIALDRLDDDDVQVYAQPNVKGKSMTKDDALTLEALKYAASMGHRLIGNFGLFTIKSTLAQPAQPPLPVQPEPSSECNPQDLCAGCRCKYSAQPVQEPVAYYHPHKGFYWAKPTHIAAPTVVDVPPVPLYTTPPAPLPVQPEPRNFCPRCGKRTRDLTTIHTCTPPEGGHQ
jgi:hypothetical protein